MNFYKHYLGDYARDTADLSLLEHGAYRVLLDHYYAQHGDMPGEPQALYRICKAFTPAERKAVDKVASRFFQVNGDGRRHNHRADIEIEKHRGQTEANRIVAEERERKRREERKRHDLLDDPSTNRSPTRSQKPEESKPSAANAAEVRDGVAAVPGCPHEKIIEAYHELLPLNPRVLEWNDTRRGYMRSRWREKSVRRDGHRGYATQEEGVAYWRRFFRYVAESPFLTGQASGRDGKPPFVASLEWLVKPSNFAKVIEGAYHR